MQKPYKVIGRAVLISCLAGAGIYGIAGATQTAAPATTEISPMDSNIRYIGRFDSRDPSGPRCSWSDSGVQVRFRGTSIDARINETGNDQFEIIVDRGEPKALALQKGERVYPLAQGLPEGMHTMELYKRTEPFVGMTQFLGFSLNAGGRLLPSTPAKRRIEVVGDSITCGYGNEGKDQNEHFTPATENAYMTYGAIAARALGADYTCIAWSGRKMSPDDTMGEIYDRTLPTDASSNWDFSRSAENVVVVNLATNDFGRGVPDRDSWTKAYEAFINRVRKNYPLAEIYCATSPMMSDTWPPNRKDFSTLKDYLTQIVAEENRSGDTRVRLIEFATQDPKNGLGSDWHPNVKTHELMAEKLETTLEADLGWRPLSRE